jgi:hypothetical protein
MERRVLIGLLVLAAAALVIALAAAAWPSLDGCTVLTTAGPTRAGC